MLLFHYFVTLLLIFQVNQPVHYRKRIVTTFFNASWQEVDSASARYKISRMYADDSTGKATVTAFDLPAGTIKYLIRYADVTKGLKHGPELHYYADGTLKLRAFYRNGQIVDTLRSFYPSQQLRRVEAYREGKRTSATCWNPDGTETTCPPLTTEPQPFQKNGLDIIARNTAYPELARSEGIQGRVVATLTVTSAGRIANLHVSKPVHPLLDNALLEAIRKANLVWIPGTLEGEPIDMQVSIPMIFKTR